jgi:hypothetical protein
MILHTPIGTFVVHTHHDVPARTTFVGVHPDNGSECKRPVCENVRYSGQATASLKDQFSRRIGRWIAFGRATKALNRADRAVLLAAYKLAVRRD